MAAGLPPDSQWRYRRKVRRQADRLGFLLVAAWVLCFIEFFGDPGVLSVQWLTTLPATLGFTMFSGRPERRLNGYPAPLFAQFADHTSDK
jgi:hypothetical protein